MEGLHSHSIQADLLGLYATPALPVLLKGASAWLPAEALTTGLTCTAYGWHPPVPFCTINISMVCC